VQGALKRVASIGGTVLCVVAAVLLIARCLALGDAVGEQLSRLSVSSFVIALLLYLVGSVLLAFAWVVLVRASAAGSPRTWPLLRGHLRAQVAKYLPGNVFHFAYRHVAARREGVAHASLGAALGLEAALLLAAAGIVALGVVSDPRIEAVVPWARQFVWLAPSLALLAWLALSFVAPRFGIPDAPVMQRAPRLALVLAINFVFFALAGAALRELQPQAGAMPFSAWCGWLALAWLLGYVTPGAPAGLGLREGVLALGLTPVLGESEALALALVYRLVTVIADGVLAAVGFVVLREKVDAAAS